MRKEPLKIGFALVSISTEQFAMLDFDSNNLNSTDEIKLETEIKFGINIVEKLFTVYPSFKFQKNTSPFLIIETGCHFSILENDWKLLINDEQMIFPKGLVTHLSVIAVGTTRGILHEKTDGTRHNEFLLPTINLTEIIDNDIKLNIDDFE